MLLRMRAAEHVPRRRISAFPSLGTGLAPRPYATARSPPPNSPAPSLLLSISYPYNNPPVFFSPRISCRPLTARTTGQWPSQPASSRWNRTPGAAPASQVRALARQLRPQRLKQWSKMPFHPGSLYLIGFPSLSKRAFFLPRSSGLPSVPCRETQVSMLWERANSSRHSGSMADAADCQHRPNTAFIVDCMHSGSTAAGV